MGKVVRLVMETTTMETWCMDRAMSKKRMVVMLMKKLLA
jgi:hypothetical protein